MADAGIKSITYGGETKKVSDEDTEVEVGGQDFKISDAEEEPEPEPSGGGGGGGSPAKQVDDTDQGSTYVGKISEKGGTETPKTKEQMDYAKEAAKKGMSRSEMKKYIRKKTGEGPRAGAYSAYSKTKDISQTKQAKESYEEQLERVKKADEGTRFKYDGRDVSKTELKKELEEGKEQAEQALEHRKEYYEDPRVVFRSGVPQKQRYVARAKTEEGQVVGKAEVESGERPEEGAYGEENVPERETRKITSPEEAQTAIENINESISDIKESKAGTKFTIGDQDLFKQQALEEMEKKRERLKEWRQDYYTDYLGMEEIPQTEKERKKAQTLAKRKKEKYYEDYLGLPKPPETEREKEVAKDLAEAKEDYYTEELGLPHPPETAKQAKIAADIEWEKERRKYKDLTPVEKAVVGAKIGVSPKAYEMLIARQENPTMVTPWAGLTKFLPTKTPQQILKEEFRQTQERFKGVEKPESMTEFFSNQFGSEEYYSKLAEEERRALLSPTGVTGVSVGAGATYQAGINVLGTYGGATSAALGKAGMFTVGGTVAARKGADIYSKIEEGKFTEAGADVLRIAHGVVGFSAGAKAMKPKVIKTETASQNIKLQETPGKRPDVGSGKATVTQYVKKPRLVRSGANVVTRKVDVTYPTIQTGPKSSYATGKAKIYSSRGKQLGTKEFTVRSTKIGEGKAIRFPTEGKFSPQQKVVKTRDVTEFVGGKTPKYSTSYTAQKSQIDITGEKILYPRRVVFTRGITKGEGGTTTLSEGKTTIFKPSEESVSIFKPNYKGFSGSISQTGSVGSITFTKTVTTRPQLVSNIAGMKPTGKGAVVSATEEGVQEEEIVTVDFDTYETTGTTGEDVEQTTYETAESPPDETLTSLETTETSESQVISVSGGDTEDTTQELVAVREETEKKEPSQIEPSIITHSPGKVYPGQGRPERTTKRGVYLGREEKGKGVMGISPIEGRVKRRQGKDMSEMSFGTMVFGKGKGDKKREVEKEPRKVMPMVAQKQYRSKKMVQLPKMGLLTKVRGKDKEKVATFEKNIPGLRGGQAERQGMVPKGMQMPEVTQGQKPKEKVGLNTLPKMKAPQKPKKPQKTTGMQGLQTPPGLTTGLPGMPDFKRKRRGKKTRSFKDLFYTEKEHPVATGKEVLLGGRPKKRKKKGKKKRKKKKQSFEDVIFGG